MYSNKINKLISLVALSTVVISNASAHDIGGSDSNFAIGAKIGTQGAGIEGRTFITDNLYARLSANYLHYHHDFGDDGKLSYKAKLTLFTVPLMLDFHPIDDSGFRVSAGVAYNGNKVKATATPNKSITLYGHTYSPAEIGKATATMKLGSNIGGIVTIGYDNSLRDNNPWSFNAEAGLMYTGKPKIKVTATGISGSQTQKIADLNRDANHELKDAKKYLRFFPILSIGFKYNF